jgi:hypothetical protein
VLSWPLLRPALIIAKQNCLPVPALSYGTASRIQILIFQVFAKLFVGAQKVAVLIFCKVVSLGAKRRRFNFLQSCQLAAEKGKNNASLTNVCLSISDDDNNHSNNNNNNKQTNKQKREWSTMFVQTMCLLRLRKNINIRYDSKQS